jgi:threonine dehydratase
MELRRARSVGDGTRAEQDTAAPDRVYCISDGWATSSARHEPRISVNVQTVESPGTRADEARRIHVDGIAAAAAGMDPAFAHTPQFVSDGLSERLGMRMLCKVETLNPIRSFKGRGTDRLLHRLSADGGADAETELVCASAGNFGQGLAYAARRRGTAVRVFAAETANPFKVERMRQLGAHVQLAGRDFDAAKDAARAYAGERAGALFVEDGREPAIAEGAGTIAVEMDGWPEPLDAVLVPLGNGSLLAGMGTWLRAHRPETRIVGVCAARAPAMALSLDAGHPVTTATADSIADGIAMRIPVPEALDDLRGIVDEVLLVEEAAIVDAMRLVFDTLGLVVEPAGVVGIAAAAVHRARFAGMRVATPLCGGNLTAQQARRWLTPPSARMPV